jgi:hypothetical protein
MVFLGKSKYTGWLALFVCIQISMLFVYLNLNIANVGSLGTALPILIASVIASLLIMGIFLLQKRLHIRLHFFLFIGLMVWIALRVVVDTADLNYLTQITIATTGGMLLFYFLGAFLGVSYEYLLLKSMKTMLVRLVLIFFFSLLVWVLYEFSQRLHPRVFYLTGIDGAYQRPGNFLSISFILCSFYYLLFSLKHSAGMNLILSSFAWLVMYIFLTFMCFMSSQLIGSNSATGVILGVFLITLVMSLLASRKRLRLSYFTGELALPFSRQLVKGLLFFSAIGIAIFLSLIVFVVGFTGFDLTSMRVFGFGTGSNNSIVSRFEILMESGMEQVGLAPFFGNMDVAYLTTGSSGRTLHSFFPNVMAHLGLLGLIIILIIFFSVFKQLLNLCRCGGVANEFSYQNNMIAIYSAFVLAYLIFFANLATGLSWIVLWFTFGFVSRPFSLYENGRNTLHSNNSLTSYKKSLVL